MEELIVLIKENLLETSVIIAFLTIIGAWVKGKLDLRIANAKINSDERIKFYSDMSQELADTKSLLNHIQMERSTERLEVERLKILVYKLHNEVKDLIGICDRHGIRFTRRSDDGYIEEVLGIQTVNPPPPPQPSSEE